MTLIGDIDEDSDVDLTDAIMVLKEMTGYEPALAGHVELDVNGDDRIGLEDARYILQTLSGVSDG